MSKKNKLKYFDIENTIKVKKKGKYWIATYKTMDVVTQGETKLEARLNLIELIAIHIDFAVANGNEKYLFPLRVY